MPSKPDDLLSYLRGVLGAWRNDPRDDDELLARFTQHSDEEAFKVLVGRYGLLVWRCCTRVLGESPDAEDVFQTTFLALARKAGRLPIKNLAGWLHQVARRAALNAEAGVRRRQSLEQQLRAVTQPPAERGDARTELYAALDEELAGLPERLRVPLLLRYLEGKTLEDVARLIGCSRPVVSKRLVRGEVLLRKRLERRGLTVGFVSVGALLGSTAPALAVPTSLIGSTAQAALRSLSFPLESSTSVTLAEGVMKTMGVAKMKVVTVLLGVTLSLAGGGVLAYQALAGKTAESPQPAGEPRGEAETSRQPGIAARVDCLGDPLPAHALARMGTTRLRARCEGTGCTPAFSPDGKTLATLHYLPSSYHPYDVTVYLCDAATGREIRRLTTKATRKPIFSLGFSRDGKTLVAMDSDRAVCLWEVATGKFLRKQEYQGLSRDGGPSRNLAFLPDGKILAFENFQKSVEQGRQMKGVYVWEVTTGKEICQLSEPAAIDDGRLFSDTGAFSADGKMLATAKNRCGKRTVKTVISLWDIATGKEVRQLIHDGDKHVVKVVTFSADGKTLASATHNKICVWEVATGKKIHGLKVEEGMEPNGPLIFSPDSKTLVGGKTGHLFDVGTGKEIRSFGWRYGYHGEHGAEGALFSPDGKVLATEDSSGGIRLWEVATGKEIGPRKGFRGGVQSIAYSPDSKTLASMGVNETVVSLWEVVTGKKICQLAKHTKHRGGSGSIAYSPDGKMLVSTENHVLHLWDAATGEEIWRFESAIPTLNRGDFPMLAAFSPDGKNLAAFLNDDKTIRLWEAASGKQIYIRSTEMQSDFHPMSVVFSPDGRLLAAPGKDNKVCVWEAATGKLIGQLSGTENLSQNLGRLEGPCVWSLAFSPDGRILATSGSRDKNVRLWEVFSGKEIRQLDGMKNKKNRESYRLAFSPDSRILATAAQWCGNGSYIDPKVHLWDVASGKEIGQLTGHQDFVRTIAFSPDGKTLASGSDDLTCLVWDVTPFVGRLKPVPVRPLPVQTLSEEQLEAAWVDLAKDPVQAYAAIGTLRATPTQASALLQTRVRPVTPADPQRWIADLDADSFAVRDKARREITKLGEAALPALRQALKGQPSVEVRRQLKDLLVELEPQEVAVPPQRMRELRAVQVLESIGTVEARQLLQAWAKGVPGVRLTVEAEVALIRLAKRSAAKP